jgi:hypothetical protein
MTTFQIHFMFVPHACDLLGVLNIFIPNVVAWPFEDQIVYINVDEMGPYIADISSLPLLK